MKQISFLILTGVLTILGIVVLLPQSAYANTYPGNSISGQDPQAISSSPDSWWGPEDNRPPAGWDNPSGFYNCSYTGARGPSNLDVSGQDTGACATGLTATETRYKLFKPVNNSGLTVELLDICRGSDTDGFNKPSSPDKGAREVRIEVYPTNNNRNISGLPVAAADNNCPRGNRSMNFNVPAIAFNQAQADRYGNNVETAVLVIKKTPVGNPDPGNQVFRLRVTGYRSYVYGDDDAGRLNQGYFALVSQRDSGSGDYVFRLKVDCKGDTLNPRVSVADPDYWNTGVQTNPWGPIFGVRRADGSFINLEREQTGDTSIYFGLDRNYTFRFIDSVSPGEIITVRIDSVSNSNGLRIYLPFSEYDDYDCPPPSPPPQSEPDCTRFEWTLGANSRYKFTVFTSGQSFNGPPNRNDRVNGGNNRNWRNLPGAVQTQIIDNTDNVQRTRSFNFGAPAGKDWVVYVERWQRVGTNGQGRGIYEYGLQDAPVVIANCFVAQCESLSLTTGTIPGRGNGVPANGVFGVALVIRNIGRADLPGNTRGYNLTATDTDWGLTQGVGGIPRGAAVPVSFNLTAPPGIGTKRLDPYPDYYGFFGLGPGCGIDVNTYLRYEFTASANTNLIPNRESPTSAQFVTTLTQTGEPVDGAVSTRSYFKQRTGVNTPIGGVTTPIPNPESGTFGNRVYTDNYNIPPNSFILGDGWCVSITLDKGRGWKGPGGDYVNEGPATADNCNPANPPPTVQNIPYIRAYGADVAAGGGFAGNCSRTNSKILSFLNPLSQQNSVANKSGSGGQLAAMALGEIMGFTSASNRTTDPQLSKGLTFAHNNAAPSDNDSPPLGGNMSGDGWCVPDYYTTTQFPDGDSRKNSSPANTSISVNGLTTGEQTVRTINGAKLVLDGSGAALYNRKHTVYVDGDVFIRNNIAFSTNYAGGIGSIPSFALIVRGDIYIDNDVTQLDGLYIAQPFDRTNDGDVDDASDGKGRIYTCATEGSGNNPVTTGTGIYNECGGSVSTNDRCNPGTPRSLMVNGAFVAQRVVLNRAGYTLSCSTFREQANASKASEIFNYSPEMLLAPPVFRAECTVTSGCYQSIAVLAPIL